MHTVAESHVDMDVVVDIWNNLTVTGSALNKAVVVGMESAVDIYNLLLTGSDEEKSVAVCILNNQTTPELELDIWNNLSKLLDLLSDLELWSS